MVKTPSTASKAALSTDASAVVPDRWAPSKITGGQERSDPGIEWAVNLRLR
jgi:hypothetical protein